MNFRAEAGDKFATSSFHQSHCGKQVTYRVNRIQNDIIQCCGDEIRAQIVREVNASPFFTVLADEACDCSNQEQMPIVVRFIDSKHVIREEFLGFALCSEGTGGRALAELIIAKFAELGLELSRLRRQGYDGAGNMAGRLYGCAVVIAEQYPNTLYIHCSSHCLNLCVVAASKITTISNMWSTLLEISIFFKYSPKRQGKLESCPLHISRTNGPIVPRCCRLGQCEWSFRYRIGRRVLIGRPSGGHRAILNMFNIARRRRPIGSRTCTTQLRAVINKTLSPYQPGTRTILYNSLEPTDANGHIARHSANVNGVTTRRRMVSSRFASDYIGGQSGHRIG